MAGLKHFAQIKLQYFTCFTKYTKWLQ